jgi:isopentenyl phosphate kinase
MVIASIVVGIIFIIIGVSGFYYFKDRVVPIILCVFGIGLLGLSGMLIVNSSVSEHVNITPCSIYGYLVEDTNETIYVVGSDEIMLQLHVNQTREAVVYRQFLIDRPKIMNVTGSKCPCLSNPEGVCV